MKEINTLLKLYNSATKPAALATVINVEGSSYRREGARMLIYENGTWKGGISGGCLERDVLKNAKRVLTEQKARIVRYDTTEDDANNLGVGLGCNGIIDILISPLDRNNPRNPLEVLRTYSKKRHPALLLSVLENETTIELAPGDMIPYSSLEEFSTSFDKTSFMSDISSDIKSVLFTQKTKIVEYKTREDEKLKLLFEILIPNTHLIIAGTNYDVYPMVELANVLGWDCSIIGNPLKLGKQVFELARVFPPADQKDPKMTIDPYTALVLMSHDYKTDYKNLSYFIKSKVAYIGLLGPKKRGDKLIQELMAKGEKYSKEDLDRIYRPTGLDIGATSPEEIALSIISGVKARFSKRKGGFLAEREGSIHVV